MTKFANNQLVWSWIWNFVMFIVWLLDAAQAVVTGMYSERLSDIFRPPGRKIVLGKYNCPSTWRDIQ